MPENVSISVNGESQIPPGFRFHPTEEELLQYYLRKKVSYQQIDLDVIRDVDLNKLEPWDIQDKCKIGSTPQNYWYFFSHKDKKYPSGTRTNRATAAGFWKATGRDKVIRCNSKRIGMRKTLVFYKGRAPHGHKSDWIMHEYRLHHNNINSNSVPDAAGEATQDDGWVVCRIFNKKNHPKTIDSPANSAIDVTSQINSSSGDEGTLEQILQYVGIRNCKNEDELAVGSPALVVPPVDTAVVKNGLRNRFMKLPSLDLESRNNYMSGQPAACYKQIQLVRMNGDGDPNSVVYQSETRLSDWTAFDRLVASQLNGLTDDTTKQQQQPPQQQLAYFNESSMPFSSPTYNHLHLHLQQQLRTNSSNRPSHGSQLDFINADQFDLWSFIPSSLSSADPLCHLSNTPPITDNTLNYSPTLSS